MAQKDFNYQNVNVEGGNMLGNGSTKKTKTTGSGSNLFLYNLPGLGNKSAPIGAVIGTKLGYDPKKATGTGATGATGTGTTKTATAAPTPAMTMAEYQKANEPYRFMNDYNTPTTSRSITPAVTDATVTAPAATTAPAEMTDEEKAADLESRTFGLRTTGSGASPVWTDVNTPVRGQQGTFTGRDMDSALNTLRTEFDRNMGTYRPKTEQEIQAQARSDYQSYYDQLRRAALNEYGMNDLALQQQRAGLQSSYDKSREASAKQYRQAYSNADRALLNRGMQRSSYAMQTLANVDMQGAEAQQAIWDAQVAAEGNIDAQRRQLAGNLANTMMGYDAGQASDVMSRVWGLRDTEYERQVNRANTLNSLANQLYGYLSQNNEYARNQWNTENTMRENQHQFDVGVAQARQGVEDSRSQFNANMAEEQRQYNNSANMSELNFRAQYPDYGFSRAEDGRIVRDAAPTRGMSSVMDTAYQEEIQTLKNELAQAQAGGRSGYFSGYDRQGEIYAQQLAAEYAAKNGVKQNKTANTNKGTDTKGSTGSTAQAKKVSGGADAAELFSVAKNWTNMTNNR